jgi:hypothetical protein
MEMGYPGIDLFIGMFSRVNSMAKNKHRNCAYTYGGQPNNPDTMPMILGLNDIQN